MAEDTGNPSDPSADAQAPSYTPADAPIDKSKLFGGKSWGLLAAIATIGMGIYALATGKLEGLSGRSAEYEFDRLERDRLKLLQDLRRTEREEEAHVTQMRLYDAGIQRELTAARYFETHRHAEKAQSLAHQAEQRAHEARERYYKAKLELLVAEATEENA